MWIHLQELTPRAWSAHGLKCERSGDVQEATVLIYILILTLFTGILLLKDKKNSMNFPEKLIHAFHSVHVF